MLNENHITLFQGNLGLAQGHKHKLRPLKHLAESLAIYKLKTARFVCPSNSKIGTEAAPVGIKQGELSPRKRPIEAQSCSISFARQNEEQFCYAFVGFGEYFRILD